MYIEIESFGEIVKNIYFELKNMTEKEIIVILDPDMIESNEGGRLEVGENFKIYIVDKSREDIVLHEFFHIYFRLKQYPSVYYYPDMIEKNCYKLGCVIADWVIHKLILEEEEKRNIKLNLQNEEILKKLNGLIENFEIKERKDYMDLIITCVTYYFECTEKEFVITLLEKNFPEIYHWQKELIDIVEKMQIPNSPFRVGRTITKLYKKIDDIALNFKLDTMELYKNIMLETIFTKRQLNLNMEQVFNFEQLKNGQKYLELKATKQNGVYIMPEDEEERIMKMTVREFYNYKNAPLLIKK